MLRRILHSFITAYVVIVIFVAIGLYFAEHENQRDIHRNCVTTEREWDTFQHLINAAVHPPSQAGHPLTADEIRALAAYRDGLNASIGVRPPC